jgi:hypothetical protein
MTFFKKTFPAFLLGAIFLFSTIFSSPNPYSINKIQDNLGETRKISELVFSLNRLELKNKLELIIYNSQIRNLILKNIAELSWTLQEGSRVFDYQFFNTEIFYGKNGELFPKYSNCNSYNYQNLILEPYGDTEFIFLIVPMKQEIENSKIHSYQKINAICNNSNNLNLFIREYQNEKVHILNLYSLFSDERKRYYEYGDTHWNDFGVKTVISKVLEITHNQSEISLKQEGYKKENNLVLSRLGLIEIETFQDNYILEFQPTEIRSVLIVRDSFFSESYVSINFLNNFYDIDFISWGTFQNIESEQISNFYNVYDFVIFESSIDSFFESRILKFSN